jgi:hypothetical protein
VHRSSRDSADFYGGLGAIPGYLTRRRRARFNRMTGCLMQPVDTKSLSTIGVGSYRGG